MADQNPMAYVTIFGTPKPFKDQFARIQRNTIKNWVSLGDEVDVLIIGDDEGTIPTCSELGAPNWPVVSRSPKNVPLLDDLWRIAHDQTTTERLLFSNADILFTDDLVPALRSVDEWADGPYLIIGQRWDVRMDDDLDTTAADWAGALRDRASEEGTLNSPLWVDWFAFPKGVFVDLPPFAVGRPGYDHWLVWHALARGIPVIDATDAVIAVHQHHDYSHGGSHADVWFGEDAQRNKELLGGRRRMRHIGHATHRLRRDHSIVGAIGMKYALSRAHTALGPVLERTMTFRHRHGLDAERVQGMAQALTRR